MSNVDRTYTISQLAREFEVTPRALRFYEDKGLLTPRREGLNRVYSYRDRGRLLEHVLPGTAQNRRRAAAVVSTIVGAAVCVYFFNRDQSYAAIMFGLLTLFGLAEAVRGAAPGSSHRHTPACDIFNLVRLVEDNSRIVGKNSAECLIPNCEIGKEQVMIHNDDVALERAAVHFSDKATIELLALLAGAEIASRIQLPPGATVLRQFTQFAAVSRFRFKLPSPDELGVSHLLQPGKDGLAF